MLRRCFKTALIALAATGVAATLHGGARADSVAPGGSVSNDSNSSVTVSNPTANSTTSVSTTSQTVVGASSGSITGQTGTTGPSDTQAPPDSQTANPDETSPETPTTSDQNSSPTTTQNALSTTTTPVVGNSVVTPGRLQSWQPLQRLTQPGQPELGSNQPDSSGSQAPRPSTPAPLNSGFFISWLKPLLLPTFSSVGAAKAIATVESVDLSVPAKLLAGLVLLSAWFVLWLRRSGYAHGARSDAPIFPTFATPRKTGCRWAFVGVGSSSFYGVRYKNLINVWRERG